MNLSASIVICTDGRRANLANTLHSLRHLDHERFEVCVVSGPTEDGTRAMLDAWPYPLKRAHVGVRNLSVSRNLGIELAAGQIVAFLDDDGMPEAEWLDQILAGYANERVGAVGGVVFNHTGVDYQWRFGTADRLGRADVSWLGPAGTLNFPYSYSFPHLLGANATFRRRALIEIGGFDEEFDYFLDETDVSARLIDAGWSIIQLAGAYVHHKYAPSEMRSEARVIKSWYSILKNKLYYGLKHRHGYHTVREVLREFDTYCQSHRDSLTWAISSHHLTDDYLPVFEKEVVLATEDGFKRAFSGERKLLSQERRSSAPPDFQMFRPRATDNRKRFCFLSQQYPPGVVGGTARYVYELATGMAELGHDVHVLTMTAGSSRVDFEDGVWVHRLVPGDLPKPFRPAQSITASASQKIGAREIPSVIWEQCLTRLVYFKWLCERKVFDCVYSLIWDCEGAAILRDGQVPLVVGLQTTLAFWLDTNNDRKRDLGFMESFGHPMLELEKEMLSNCSRIHAISRNILRDIEQKYAISIAPRATVIPLGFDDLAAEPYTSLPHLSPDIHLRVLFVGRLEARKGIDVLLSVAPELLAKFPNVQIDIVGNDTLPVPETTTTYRQAFTRKALDPDVAKRIVFHGEVDAALLRAFYACCDVFVAPSRYESFGIIFVEAMMFGKAVIGCRAGGMPEVIEDGVTGLLAHPGDAASLRDCLMRLLSDAEFRTKLGRNGRRRYETHFAKARMIHDVAELMVSAKLSPSALSSGLAHQKHDND